MSQRSRRSLKSQINRTFVRSRLNKSIAPNLSDRLDSLSTNYAILFWWIQ
ncbi:hypothetical protein [Microcoleus sp. CAWBG58]|nr:hypothetical protein [Microcoleus sp. CAWBG58]